jgi:hypothetical protein
VLVTHNKNGAYSPTGVTYGTQAMTQIGTTSLKTGVSWWYLNDSGITAASSTTIAASWSGGAPAGETYQHAILTGVNQSSPALNYGGTTGNNQSSLAQSVTAIAAGMNLVGCVTNQNTTMSFTGGSITSVSAVINGGITHAVGFEQTPSGVAVGYNCNTGINGSMSIGGFAIRPGS